MAKNPSAFPTLALPTQGKDKTHTKEAQYLLAHNRFGIKFYKGTIDGVFGPDTAAACRAAKKSLGYPLNDQKPIFGPVLRSYLVPKDHPAFKPLPKANLKRREAAKVKPFRVTVLERAQLEIGYIESPVNRTKFGKRYGMDGVAWCAIFCSCMIGFDRFKYSYVPYVVADAKAKRNGLHVTANPLPGDLVCFDWNHDHVADHIGFFGGWINREKGTFWTVEGNTSAGINGSQSNGGGVHKRTRYSSDVAVFVSYSN